MRGPRPACALLAAVALWTGAAAPTFAAADIRDRDDARRKFQDSRFGLFIPWGLFSLLGKGEWVMEHDRLPVSEYEKLSRHFNPAGFDPEGWVKTARSAGAKYLTVTAKHHDGFSMFDSRLTGYDVVDATPYAKDPLKGLADACRKHGVSLFVYYSLLDWHHPDYAPLGRTGRSAGRDGKGDWSSYVKYYQGQVRELCTNYGPIGGVWLDGAWDRPDADWDLETTYALIHRLQPDALVTNNHHSAPRPGEDVRAFDQPPDGIADGADAAPPLEVRQSLNVPPGGGAVKSLDEVIRLLVGLAGRGANLLLSVAPKPDGTIPDVAADRLAGVGRWLNRHGVSVFGTRPGPVSPQSWGVSTRDGGRGGPSAIYLHVLKPELTIRLPEHALGYDARPLGTTRLLKQEQDGNQCVVTLPDPEPSATDTVIVLTPRMLDPARGPGR